MQTEQKKLGQSHGTTQGLSPIAKAVVQQPKEYFNTDYGPDPDFVLGAESAHTHPVFAEVEHGSV